MLDPSTPTLGIGPTRNSVSREVARLRRAAWAFTTRRVPHSIASTLLRESRVPRPGDLVLARVDSLGHHAGLQLPDGRRKNLFVGDEIVVTYGNRYAPSQFEAVVPRTLGPCQMVASGGVAAKALSWHSRVTKGPTQITPIGLLADASGAPMNLIDYALQFIEQLPSPCPTTVAVVGSAMDSGKTQSAAYLVKGLTLAGVRVGYAKITGTGAGGDTWLLKDAGANPVLDFTDVGLVSTYLVPMPEVERTYITLMAHLAKSRVDAIVLEIADGVLQAETAALLQSPIFRASVGGILFAACDSMGAVGGEAWLRSQNLPVLGLSGLVTTSPLQCEEAARVTGLPIYARHDLARPGTAMKILGMAEAPDIGDDASSATPARMETQ